METNLDNIKNRILTGKSVLFCGAGFSSNCLNIKDKKIPSATELSQMICELGEFDKDDDLRYTSDYFLNRKKDKIPELIQLLKEQFTVKSVGEDTKKICSYNWRRIYTTNYDNVIEVASNLMNKYMDSICIEDSPKEYYKRNNISVHINGKISELNESSLEDTFKLTHSSYVSSNNFEKSNWYYSFKKDIEYCNSIIFIGYSLYDIEIEKILFEANYIKKTFFIVGEDSSSKSIYTLNKYGTVLAIGNDKFASHIGYYKEHEDLRDAQDIIYFKKYEIEDTEVEITDLEINNLVLNGNVEQKHIDYYNSGNPIKPYIVYRKIIDEIIHQGKDNNIVIYSDFGNGKSMILEIIKSILSIEGVLIFYADELEGDYVNDIDRIVKMRKNCVIFFDGYSKFYDIIEYIISMNSKNIKLLLSDRTNNHNHFRNRLKENIEFYEYNVDLMNNEEEYDQVINIITNLGFWGDKITWSKERKYTYIERDCNRQFANILIDVFKSPQILKKIETLLDTLVSDLSWKKNIFAICLIEILGYPLKESLISEIAGNSEIYNPKLTTNIDFKELFTIRKDKVDTRASVMSLSILQNYFSSHYIIENLLEIVERFNSKRKDSNEENTIFKSFLRFSFIEKILPVKSKKTSLVKYYQDLKIKVPWLVHDPHFWLQYGMSELTFLNYKVAQQYFDNAYELIDKKEYYDSSYIDTQQARLYLMHAIHEEKNGMKIFGDFKKADMLLSNLDNTVYKFRQVILYYDLYEKKYNILPKRDKEEYIKICAQMKRNIELHVPEKYEIHTHDYIKNRCIENLSKIKMM